MKDNRKPAVRSISPFPPSADYLMKRDTEGGLVMIAQIVLGELRIFYDALPHLPVSGSYNEETENAVRTFQRISHLPQTGEIDRETWNRMAQEYDMTVKMS